MLRMRFGCTPSLSCRRTLSSCSMYSTTTCVIMECLSLTSPFCITTASVLNVRAMLYAMVYYLSRGFVELMCVLGRDVLQSSACSVRC